MLFNITNTYVKCHFQNSFNFRSHVLSHIRPHIRQLNNQSSNNGQFNFKFDHTPVTNPLQEHPEILSKVLEGLNLYTFNLIRQYRRFDAMKIQEEIEKERCGDIQKLEKEITKEITELEKELCKIRMYLKHQTEQLLHAENRCNVQGALDYVINEVILTTLYNFIKVFNITNDSCLL